MMNLIEQLNDLQSRPEAFTRDELEVMMDLFPYCTLPMQVYLKVHGTEGNDDLLARLAIACPDRRALALQLDESATRWRDFYPDEDNPAEADTEATIDRFLDAFGNTSDKEIAAIQAAIFNPMPDYADVLAAQERRDSGNPRPADEHDRLINDFIARSQEREREIARQPAQPHVDERQRAQIANDNIDNPVNEDDTMLSQSLAQMYIKRRKYDKALEIIENINLKFPEKSIYFADQIRFLKKLVLNERMLNNK